MTKKEQITCINFIGGINDKTASLLMFIMTEQLRSGVSNFRINISSTGGNVFHAVSIHNFLSGLKKTKIHTHNLGQIDSGANLMFLAGTERTASKSSTFLLHPPEMTIQQAPVGLSIEVLSERLESIKKDEEKMAEIISRKLNKPKTQILDMFKGRKTYDSDEAKNLGFISKIDDFVAEPNTPIYTITNQS